MYEPNHSAPRRRSDDEFLRRMSCPQSGQSIPTMNRSVSEAGPIGGLENTGHPPACSHPPVDPAMPSLAMVYSPLQEWRCALSPSDALAHGTLFAELVKPFEGRSIANRGR